MPTKGNRSKPEQGVGRRLRDHVDDETSDGEVGLLAAAQVEGACLAHVAEIGNVDGGRAVDERVGAVGHGAVQPDKVVDAEAAEIHRAPVDRQRVAQTENKFRTRLEGEVPTENTAPAEGGAARDGHIAPADFAVDQKSAVHDGCRARVGVVSRKGRRPAAELVDRSVARDGGRDVRAGALVEVDRAGAVTEDNPRRGDRPRCVLGAVAADVQRAGGTHVLGKRQPGGGAVQTDLCLVGHGQSSLTRDPHLDAVRRAEVAPRRSDTHHEHAVVAAGRSVADLSDVRTGRSPVADHQAAARPVQAHGYTHRAGQGGTRAGHRDAVVGGSGVVADEATAGRVAIGSRGHHRGTVGNNQAITGLSHAHHHIAGSSQRRTGVGHGEAVVVIPGADSDEDIVVVTGALSNNGHLCSAEDADR